MYFTILIFLTLLTPTIQATTWQSITTGTQQVPAHVYLVTITNPNDFISGICYWNGTADLDIYIYWSGSNYMTRAFYAARFISSSYDSTEVFSYRPGFTGNFYIRVDDWFLPSPFPYHLNISTTSQPTTITYTNYVNPLKYFMAVTSITNMPQSSSYIPFMFTYSPVAPSPPSTNLTRIDLQLAIGTTLKRSLISNEISCLRNLNDPSTINQSWALIFNHTIPATFYQIDFYQY